jgi:hypothetical protein
MMKGADIGFPAWEVLPFLEKMYIIELQMQRIVLN